MSFNDNYRKAMKAMRVLLPKDCPPKVCLQCVGWEHFGGINVDDVSNGPVCICDKTWFKVKKWLNQKNKLFVI